MIAVGLFSLVSNLSMLIVPIYMMQVYDRVLGSRSMDTLLMLTLLAVGLVLVNGLVEIARSRVLVRVGAWLDGEIGPTLFAASFNDRLNSGQGVASQAIRDLETYRTFMTGSGIMAFFDAPWTPIYLAVIVAIHPTLGLVALIGGCLIVLMAIASEESVRAPSRESSWHSNVAMSMHESLARNAEVIQVMGMIASLEHRWLGHHRSGVAWQAIASDRIAVLQALAKIVRIVLQIAILGVGAWLALGQHMSGGAIGSASIIMGRALGPIEMAIGSWRSFNSARAARRRLEALLAVAEAEQPRSGRVKLPAPDGHVVCRNVALRLPAMDAPILQGISFTLGPGEVLGLIGPSGAGKSSLARLIMGLQQPSAGSIRLDGAEIFDWPKADLGPYLGYLPQDVELLSGTVAENISRFDPQSSTKIVAAARLAGTHMMILGLPDMYETMIGANGRVLSGGQRQRIGLARAVYGDARLIVLDEPNANLDSEGEQALSEALLTLKSQKRAVIVISHRPALLSQVDKLLVLENGRMSAFGETAAVLAELRRSNNAAAAARTQAHVAARNPHQQTRLQSVATPAKETPHAATD